MTAREQEEYTALRATIRERGTARVWMFLIGIIGWAALTFGTAALAATPLAALLPLLALAAAFEAVFALHVGVERIGRYIQATFEADSGGWEHAAMQFGRPAKAVTTDALFSVPFFLAALFNFAPTLLLNPTRAEVIFVGGAHLLFVLRLIVARAAAGRQRAVDLERFTQLRHTDDRPGER